MRRSARSAARSAASGARRAAGRRGRPPGTTRSGGDDAADERLLRLAERERQRADGPDIGLSLSGGGDGEFDPLLLARTPTSLAEQLLSHLRATAADPVEAAIAEYLVDSLDEYGYLRLDIDEACAVLRVPCSLVSEGLRRLQACDPPGIGARDLRECLLLQMRARREQGDAAEYDASPRRCCATTGTRSSSAATAIWPAAWASARPASRPPSQFIQKRLTPHPAAAFRAALGPLPQHAEHGRPPRRDRPAHPGRVHVEVQGFDALDLRVNPQYRRLYDEFRAGRAGVARHAPRRSPTTRSTSSPTSSGPTCS